MGAMGPPPGAQVAEQTPRLVLFESGHDGYGDAQRSNLRYIYPRRNRRPYSYNRIFGQGDARWQGEIAAGLAVTFLAAQVGQKDAAFFCKQWEDASNNPLLLEVYATGPAAGGEIAVIQYGALGAGQALSATPTGADFHDDGAGVPYLYVGLGAPSGGTTKVKRRDRAGTLTTCTNLIADKLLSLNNDLYITAARTNGTATSAVGKVPAGTDPAAAAQPSLTVMGFAGTNINNLAADGTGKFPVGLKPEGIFVYDRAVDVWKNQVPEWESYPHLDNGKAFWYEDGDLIVGLGAGGAVRFNGSLVVPYDPIPLYAQPNIDTTGQQIAAAGNVRHFGVLATKIGSKRQRTGGVGTTTASLLKIDCGLTTDGFNYTDYSTVVSDGKDTTALDISAMPAGGTNWIVVGSVNPFSGVYFDILNANAVGGAGVIFEVLTGFAWVRVNNVIQALSGDMSTIVQIGVTQTPWARSGWVMATADPVAAGWVASGLNVGSNKTRYWARFRYASGGALTNPTKVKGLELLPYRPPIDAANFPLDGLDRSGNFPHLLFSRTTEDGEHTTHDYGLATGPISTPVPDEIGSIVYGAVGGAGRNDSRGLLICGKNGLYWVEMALDDRASMTSWPILSPGGLIELPSIDLGAPSRLAELRIEGLEWNATGYLYYRFEDGRPWSRAGQFTNLPYDIKLPSEKRAGRYLKLAVGWTLTAAQQRQVGRPRIVMIDCLPVPAPPERSGQLLPTVPVRV